MSPSATTLESLRKIIARDFEVDPQLLQVDAQLQDFAIDSLGVIEIMFAVEEEFGITMPHAPPGTGTALNTLDDLVRYTDRLVAEQRGVNKAAEARP
jgi:acyl carrier protein